MTKEEKIKILEKEKEYMLAHGGDIQAEALTSAIKALEQEPCEDAISREDALMCLTGEIKETDAIETIIAQFGRRIRKLPPVNPQPRWIPVSEILPKENKTVITSTDYCIYPEARYTEKCGWEGACESGADYWVKIKDVIAWMPLPEPYEPQEGANE